MISVKLISKSEKYTLISTRYERPTSLVEIMPRIVEIWSGVMA
jgi:hypothetical protein